MKHETHAEYDAVASGLAERALLSAWAGLGSWHEELVLVGGLVPRYLCRPPEVAQALPRPVTLDADLGISLGASMGQYGSLQMDLQAQGFRPDPDGKARFVRRIGDYTVPLDFLTESPPATSGVAMVDGIPASITPGIDRALRSARTIYIEGVDLQGARQSCNVRVCAVGPFLALKLRAFANRQAPKDAFDVFYTMLHYDGGILAAIAAFAEEARAGNPACAEATACLTQHFADERSSAPIRAANFVFGEPISSESDDARLRRQQVQQQVVDAGQMLLSAIRA
jgi:hypothetical protein